MSAFMKRKAGLLLTFPPNHSIAQTPSVNRLPNHSLIFLKLIIGLVRLPVISVINVKPARKPSQQEINVVSNNDQKLIRDYTNSL